MYSVRQMAGISVDSTRRDKTILDSGTYEGKHYLFENAFLQ